MRQFRTTADFIYKNLSVPGIPLLVDDECRPLSVVNNYMMYLILERGRTNSSKTWQNHADALYDYFSWLEANKLNWDDKPHRTANGKEVSNLALYQRWSQATYRKPNGEKLLHSTINIRIACIESYYRWARDIVGLINWLPFITTMKPVRQGHPDAFAHTHGQQVTESSELRLPLKRKPPKLLTLEQCRVLMDAPMPRTLRLMTGLMLSTGLRNEECRTFPRKYVIDPKGFDKRERIPLHLDPQDMKLKNDKPRTVYVSWQLMAELHEYTKFGEGVIRANSYEKQIGNLPTILFLNDGGHTYSEKGLNNGYRRLWNGYLKKRKKYPPVITFHVTPHMLRHTFATLELYHESEKLDKNSRKKGLGHALAWVRDRLGHSSIQATTIYIHCIDHLDSHELNAYQRELDRMIARETDGA
jgi:integrase